MRSTSQSYMYGELASPTFPVGDSSNIRVREVAIVGDGQFELVEGGGASLLVDVQSLQSKVIRILTINVDVCGATAETMQSQNEELSFTLPILEAADSHMNHRTVT